MFDTNAPSVQPHGATQHVQVTDRAQLFVDGEHTAADEDTLKITLLLLEEIGVLKDAAPFFSMQSEVPKVKQRTRETVSKQVCFMASFLRVTTRVEHFSIQMDRHQWTRTPCGYSAAKSITQALLDQGHIWKEVKPRKGRNCTIYGCSEDFKRRLSECEGRLNFKRCRPHPIEVRQPKPDHRRMFKKMRLPLSRFDHVEVREQQNTVIRLNTHLSRFALATADGKHQDTMLRRIYSGDLKHGGRLYGDYQNLPQQDRLNCTIDGEPVCEIDLKASHVFILAAICGHPERLPQDPYAAIDWVDTPLKRKAAKTLVQCMVHASDGRPKRFPRKKGGVLFRDKYELEDVKIEDLLPGILQVMPFIEGTPCLTHFLQYFEAEILIAVLELLRNLNIPAYPIHDSLLVKRSDETAVLNVFQETLKEYLGGHAPWLDVSTADQPVRIVEPQPCPDEEVGLLSGTLKKLSASYEERGERCLEYAEQTLAIDPALTGDF
ncbi:hypothetical protein [Celeribacter sp. ULVN23_4]